MKYRELKDAEIERDNLVEAIRALSKDYSITAPDSVMEQFYIDHSASEEFINMYGHIDLSKIVWSIIEVGVDELRSIDDNATYPDYLAEVSEDASNFESMGEKVISVVPSVRAFWKNHGTWNTPPVFISGTLLNQKSSAKYHLVEGHTRVGCLIGLSKYKVINLANKHLVYYGQ